MGENDVDAGGKAGMSRKLVAGIIVAMVVAVGVGAAIWWNPPDDGANSSFNLTLYFDTQYSESEWIITLVNITTNTGNYYADPNATTFRTINATGYMQDSDYISSIKNTTSPFGMMWHDIENDNLLKVGDYLTIDKNGGDAGKLDTNGYIEVLTIYSSNSIIFLPPAEFLDMDVQKTQTGWNMTVTWVNETIPTGFMSGGNMSFRVENESGNFYGIQKYGWSVGIGAIKSDYVCPDTSYNAHNMTYYNLNWYDNDADRRLSVNDTIVIDNFSENGETLSYKFFCDKYGWGHMIFEVTLP